MNNHSRFALPGHSNDPQRFCRRFAAPALLVYVLGMSACGSPASPSASTAATSLTVVVATATGNELEPHLSPQLRNDLHRQALAGGASVVLALPNTDLVPIPLTPRRPSGEIDYGPSRGARADQEIAYLDQVLAAARSSAPELDLLTSLNTVVGLRALNPGSTDNRLVVISSGLSTKDPLDLNVIGFSQDPDRLAKDLQQRKLLGDWSGWHVVFSGLGEGAGAQDHLPESALQQLSAYWLSICRQAGAASCAADRTPPATTMRAHGADVTPIQVPSITTQTGTDGSVTEAVVPESILFSFDSATLLPGGQEALKPIAEQALQNERHICITGMTDSVTGSRAYNRELSLRRAVAVMSALIHNGLIRDQITCVRGAGSALNQPGADFTDGRPDLIKAAGLRRVVITFLPESVASKDIS